MERVLKGFHSFACTPRVYPLTEFYQTCLFLPSRSWSSFTDFGGVEGWVGHGWLVIYRNECPALLNRTRTDTVTYLSTNRVRRRLTSLIETNALPLRQTTTVGKIGRYHLSLIFV